MTRSVAPTTQLSYNTPAQQRIFPFDTEDSRVYLSRASNYLLKSIGNDVVISGFEIEDITVTDQTTVQITIGPGLLIQDSTLIEITTSTVVSLDMASYDSCFGKLVLYTNYQFLESVEENKIRFKMSYITNDGLLQAPINDPWDWHRNRIYLELYSFINSTTVSIKNISRPNFFYIAGRKYYRRGKANWIPKEDTTSTVDPVYFPLAHNQISYKIFSQLYDSNLNQLTINTLYLSNLNTVKVSIEEYKPYANYYDLVIHTPADVTTHTITQNQIDTSTYTYTLTHNSNQQYVMVQVYNGDYELVRLREITLDDENTLTLDFSNMYEDLAATYHILITKDYITEYNITDEDIIDNNRILIQHNLNKKYITTQLINNTTNTIVDSNNTIIILKDQNGLYLNSSACVFQSGDYTLLIYQNTLDPIAFHTDNVISIPYYTYVRTFEVTDLISNSITISHDLELLFPIVTVYDSLMNIVQPDVVEVVDINTLTVSFLDSTGMVGVHTICVYAHDNTVLSYTNASLDPVTFDLQVDLAATDILNPIFQLYNGDNQLTYPDDIQKISETLYSFNFDKQPDIDNFNITIANATLNSYVVTFDETDVDPITYKLQIEHGLESSYPLVQLYLNNYIIFPNQITIIDINTIELDLTYIDLTESQSFECIILAGLPKLPNVFRYDNAYYAEFSEDDLTDRKLVISHDLNFMYPIVQVYNETNIIIYTPVISVQTKDQLTVDFTDLPVVDPFYKVIVMSSKSATTL